MSDDSREPTEGERLQWEVSMMTMPGHESRRRRILDLRNVDAMNLMHGRLEKDAVERCQAQGRVQAYDAILSMDSVVQEAFKDLMEQDAAGRESADDNLEGHDKGVFYEASQ